MKKILFTVLVVAGFFSVSHADTANGSGVAAIAEKVKSAATEAAKEVKDAAKTAAHAVSEKVAKATAPSDSAEIRIFQADNSDGKITPETIQKAFEKAGFYMAANNGMNFPFKRDFNNTYYDVFNLAAFYSADVVKEFIKEYPTIGLFAPMTMSIYTKKGDKTISVATLSPARMAEISGIPADHKGWKKLDEMLQKALKSAMPNGKWVPYTAKKVPVKGPLTVTATMKMGDDWEDRLEDLENDFESALTVNKFAMPAFNELSEDIEDTGYDFYIVYSVCKIPVAYTISKNHPEMGAYAPCSMYIYKKEGDETVHFGIHHVKNWIHSMGLTEKEEVQILNDAMSKVEDILKKTTSAKAE